MRLPWRQVDPMSERHRSILDARRRIASLAELCAHYGISRKTGYNWLGRAEADGRAHVAEQSRRPPYLPARHACAPGHAPARGPAPPSALGAS